MGVVGALEEDEDDRLRQRLLIGFSTTRMAAAKGEKRCCSDVNQETTNQRKTVASLFPSQLLI